MSTLRTNLLIVAVSLFIFLPSQSTAFDLGGMLDEVNKGLKVMDALNEESERRKQEMNKESQGQPAQQQQTQQQTETGNAFILPAPDGRLGAKELKRDLEEHNRYLKEVPGYQVDQFVTYCLNLYNRTAEVDDMKYRMRKCNESMPYKIEKIQRRMQHIAQQDIEKANNLINFFEKPFNLLSDYPQKSEVQLKITNLKDSIGSGIPTKIKLSHNELFPYAEKIKEVFESVVPEYNRFLKIKESVEGDLKIVPNYLDRSKIETKTSDIDGAIKRGSLGEIRSGISNLDSLASGLKVEATRIATEEKRVAEEKKNETINKLVKRGQAGKGKGYKDFYFGDGVDVTKVLLGKFCKGLKNKNDDMKKSSGMFGKSLKSDLLDGVKIDDTEAVSAHCYEKNNDGEKTSLSLYFLFKNGQLNRIIRRMGNSWGVPTQNQRVINKYEKTKVNISKKGKYKLTTKSSLKNIGETLNLVAGQINIIMTEYDNGVFLLALTRGVITNIKTFVETDYYQVYAIYQSEDASKNYSKVEMEDDDL